MAPKNDRPLADGWTDKPVRLRIQLVHTKVLKPAVHGDMSIGQHIDILLHDIRVSGDTPTKVSLDLDYEEENPAKNL